VGFWKVLARIADEEAEHRHPGGSLAFHVTDMNHRGRRYEVGYADPATDFVTTGVGRSWAEAFKQDVAGQGSSRLRHNGEEV